MKKMELTSTLLELPVTDLAHVVQEINKQRMVEWNIRRTLAHERQLSREYRWRNKE